VALLSCSAGQQSYEHPTLRHGVFFHQLLQGWKGAADANKDTAVTLDEVLSYTKLKTEAFAHLELNSKQIPHLKGDFSGTWILKELPPPPLVPQGPDGSWRITQAMSFEGKPYGGKVDIRVLNSGLVQLNWLDTAGYTQAGLGFVVDGHLMAAWSSLQMYGINLYKIGQDGTLTARWSSTLDGGRVLTEVARGTPGRLEGQYTVQGDANDGSGGAYSGSMTINRYKDTYYVGYTVDKNHFHGIGLRQGDWLAVGWTTTSNNAGFGVIDYTLGGDVAQGRWTVFGKDQCSHEVLQRLGK
jgi:hypothetical protein